MFIFADMIQFPDPNQADDDGLLAQGGELSPEFLLSAYCQGIFPWFCEGEPILWWSPNPRMVLLPADFKLKKSLRQVLNKGIFELRIDTAFREVITACSKTKRRHEDETWITNDIIDGYVQLHKLGYAHSFETWFEGKLVGGLYEVPYLFREKTFWKCWKKRCSTILCKGNGRKKRHADDVDYSRFFKSGTIPIKGKLVN